MNFLSQTGKTISQAFEEFDVANPEVYETIKKLALHAISLGKKRISFYMLTEVVRWEIYLKTHEHAGVTLKGADDRRFKISNNYRPYYARKFINEFPQHADKIEVRELRSAA